MGRSDVSGAECTKLSGARGAGGTRPSALMPVVTACMRLVVAVSTVTRLAEPSAGRIDGRLVWTNATLIAVSEVIIPLSSVVVMIKCLFLYLKMSLIVEQFLLIVINILT